MAVYGISDILEILHWGMQYFCMERYINSVESSGISGGILLAMKWVLLGSPVEYNLPIGKRRIGFHRGTIGDLIERMMWKYPGNHGNT